MRTATTAGAPHRACPNDVQAIASRARTMPDPPASSPHTTLDRGGAENAVLHLAAVAARGGGTSRSRDQGRASARPSSSGGIPGRSSTGARSRSCGRTSSTRTSSRPTSPAGVAGAKRRGRAVLSRRSTTRTAYLAGTASAPRRGDDRRRAARRRTRSSRFAPRRAVLPRDARGAVPRTVPYGLPAPRAVGSEDRCSAPAADAAGAALVLCAGRPTRRRPRDARPAMPRVTRRRAAPASSFLAAGRCRTTCAHTRGDSGSNLSPGFRDDPAPAFAPPTRGARSEVGRLGLCRRGGAVREAVVARASRHPEVVPTERPDCSCRRRRPVATGDRSRASSATSPAADGRGGSSARRDPLLGGRYAAGCRDLYSGSEAGARGSWWSPGRGVARVLEAMFRRLPQRGIEGTAVLSPGRHGDARRGEEVRLDVCASTCAARELLSRRRRDLELPRVRTHDLIHATREGRRDRAPRRPASPVVHLPGSTSATSTRRATRRRYSSSEAPARNAHPHCVSESEPTSALRHGLATGRERGSSPEPRPARRPVRRSSRLPSPVRVLLMAARLAEPKTRDVIRRADSSIRRRRRVLLARGLMDQRRRRQRSSRPPRRVRNRGADVRTLLAGSHLAVLASRS